MADDKTRARPRTEWHEEDGPVLWWHFPIEEPPYAGTPLDHGFPDHYVTHWTRLDVPTDPTGKVGGTCPEPYCDGEAGHDVARRPHGLRAAVVDRCPTCNSQDKGAPRLCGDPWHLQQLENDARAQERDDYRLTLECCKESFLEMEEKLAEMTKRAEAADKRLHESASNREQALREELRLAEQNAKNYADALGIRERMYASVTAERDALRESLDMHLIAPAGPGDINDWLGDTCGLLGMRFGDGDKIAAEIESRNPLVTDAPAAEREAATCAECGYHDGMRRDAIDVLEAAKCSTCGRFYRIPYPAVALANEAIREETPPAMAGDLAAPEDGGNAGVAGGELDGWTDEARDRGLGPWLNSKWQDALAAIKLRNARIRDLKASAYSLQEELDDEESTACSLRDDIQQLESQLAAALAERDAAVEFSKSTVREGQAESSGIISPTPGLETVKRDPVVPMTPRTRSWDR